MSVAIDVSDVRPDGFSFRPSGLAELVSVLHVVVEPGHHPSRTAWVAAITDTIDPPVLERIYDLDYLWRTSRADMFLPADPADSLAGDLDALDALDDETWVSAALLTSSCGTIPLDRTLGSPLIDENAADLARRRASLRGSRQLALAESILADPERSRARVRAVLESVDDAFFDDVWRRVRPFLVDDARRKSDLHAVEGLSGALLSLAPAVSVDATSTRITVDKLQDDFARAETGGVTFIPTVFGHPHLLVVHAPHWAPVIQYPIAAFRDAVSTVSVEVVERRLRSLDNPVRMRLVRSLARGPKTTSELASIWGLGAPEVSRHIATLKSAGLVTSDRAGRQLHHRLDLVTLSSLGQDLLQALLR